MTEQWQELKETITEMRDNDGTGTQQEVCKFLTNYMEILEKQMQQPCEDCVSRKLLSDNICEGISCNECSFNEIDGESGCLLQKRFDELPSAQLTRPTGKWLIAPDKEEGYDVADAPTIIEADKEGEDE